MKIELTDDGLYVATIAYEQRLRFRADGWTWDPALKKWTTRDRLKVIPWQPFCVGRARDVLDQQLAYEKERIAPSVAVDADIDIPAPDAVRISNHKPYAYHPFQKAGVKFIHEHNNTLLADPPGLGKTIQAIGASNLDQSIRRVLIIAPAYLKIHWKRTWEEWDVKHLTVGIAHVRAYQKDKQLFREPVWPDTEVVIINKELLEKFDDQIKVITWDMLVVDEYHIGFTQGKNKASKCLYGGRYTKPKRKKKDDAESGDENIPTNQSTEAAVPLRDTNDGSPNPNVDALRGV